MGSAVRQPRTPPRADTVGSLLRPAPLKQAVESFYAPGHSAVLAEERRKDRAELRDLEDRAIRDAVRRQIDIGLDVVTDGEFRRWMFLNSFYDAVEGFRTDNVVQFRNTRGEDVPLAVHEIVDRLRPVDSPAAREAAFLREATLLLSHEMGSAVGCVRTPLAGTSQSEHKRAPRLSGPVLTFASCPTVAWVTSARGSGSRSGTR